VQVPIAGTLENRFTISPKWMKRSLKVSQFDASWVPVKDYFTSYLSTNWH